MFLKRDGRWNQGSYFVARVGMLVEYFTETSLRFLSVFFCKHAFKVD